MCGASFTSRWALGDRKKTHNVASGGFSGSFCPETRGACGRALQYHSREETCRRPSPPSRSRHGARRAARRVRATRRPRAYRPGTPTLRRDLRARSSCHALVFRGHPPRPPRAAAAPPSPRAARGSGTTPSGSGRSTACPRSSRARRERGTPGRPPARDLASPGRDAPKRFKDAVRDRDADAEKRDRIRDRTVTKIRPGPESSPGSVAWNARRRSPRTD